MAFFRGGFNFHIKNKLKSEIFNDKNLSAKILTKNLVTFKRQDNVRDERL